MQDLSRREALAAAGGVLTGAATTGASIGAVWWSQRETGDGYSLGTESKNARYDLTDRDGVTTQAGPPALDGGLTIGILPDTQLYAAGVNRTKERLYGMQTMWVADHCDYGIHLGDMVENPIDREQWGRASGAHQNLDAAEVPYGVVAGNHDVAYDQDGFAPDIDGPYGYFRRHFPRARLDGDGAEVVDSKTGTSRHYAHRVTVGEQPLLVLYTSLYGPASPPLDWAHDVLEGSDDPAILVAHSYTGVDGSRRSYGEQLAALPQTHDNINCTLSAHVFASSGPNVAHTERDGWTECWMNYQNLYPTGGEGWLNTLTIDGGEARLDTYSPYHDQRATSGPYQTTLDWR